MSGQQIGTAVGFVAGFFLPGGPQVWAAVGGMIGGYVDPTKIYGPKLTDGMAVTALDGIPNPWGFGTFSVGCNILNAFDLIPHKNKDDGKGSGVLNITYTYTRSYMVGICRANRDPDGTYTAIAGILRATHNGKVVYNTAPDASAEQQAQNARFLKKYKFYLGGEDQLPDPTLESYLGVGNVSAYRGQVCMAATDEDQTESRGSTGTWEFVVVMDGVVSPYHLEVVDAGHQSRFQNASDPLAENPGNYDYEAYWVDESGGGHTSGPMINIDACLDWAEGLAIQGRPTILMGYSSSSQGSAGQYPDGDDGSGNFTTTSLAEDQLDVTLNAAVTLFYTWEEATAGFVDEPASGFCPYASYSEWTATFYGMVLKKFDGDIPDPGDRTLLPVDNCGGSYVAGYYPLCIKVSSKRVGPVADIPPMAVEIPDHPGYWVTPDGEVTFVPEYEEVAGTYKVLSTTSDPATDDLRVQYAYFEIGPAIPFGDPRYSDEAYWTAQYNAKVDDGKLPPDWDYGDQYPQVVGSVWQSVEVDSEIVDRNLVPLATIAAEVCRRSGLTDDEFDVSQLTDLTDGFKVAVETTGEAILQELSKGFFFDVGEWDDKLWFIKRGNNAVFWLGMSDLAERAGEAIEETEAQEVELLRKVHVKAMDPAAGFVETTQTAQRRSTTIDARGEQTLNLPIVMDKDTQAQIGDMRIKVAWTERHGLKFSLPYTRPDLTVTDVGYITDSKGSVQRIRLMEMSEDSGRIDIRESIKERQSCYRSSVEGTPHAPPSDSADKFIGPTYFTAMNLFPLRTADNTPGMYIFGAGVTEAYAGYALQMSVDGGATYQTVLDFVRPADMGILTQDITESSEPILVFMFSGELSSIETAQLADRFNGFGINTAGESECGQFVNTDKDSNGIDSLTTILRGQNQTDPAPHYADDMFVILGTGKFLEIDITYAGRTILFRPVSIGTSPEENKVYSFVYEPKFTSAPVIDFYETELGEVITTEAGDYLQVD